MLRGRRLDDAGAMLGDFFHVAYPEEGHGVRGLDARIDRAARVAGWMDAHAGPAARDTRAAGGSTR